MGSGILAITLILATAGAIIFVSLNRRAIPPAARAAPASGQRPAARAARRAGQLRPAHRPARRLADETPTKSGATISEPVSGYVMPDNDVEMVALRALAKLIEAGHVTETVALSTVFGVKAGGSTRYKEVQKKLKAAQAELGEST